MGIGSSWNTFKPESDFFGKRGFSPVPETIPEQTMFVESRQFYIPKSM
jgi:hypothetical protein